MLYLSWNKLGFPDLFWWNEKYRDDFRIIPSGHKESLPTSVIPCAAYNGEWDLPSLHVIIVSTGHVVETGILVLIVLVDDGLNVGSVIRDNNCWIYHLWNKAVLLQLSLARGALLCLLPQLDVMHILADNISKEIKHGNILAQTLLGISVRFFEKTYQCHLQQHGRFMFSACEVGLQLKCMCGLWSPQSSYMRSEKLKKYHI